MHTTKFELDIGVNPGYGHSNAETGTSLPEMVQKIAASIHELYGIYIPAVISPTTTTYATEWGCPLGGERTFRISGVRHPEFVNELAPWNQAVGAFAKALGRELNQTTAYLTFSTVDFLYLKPTEG